MGVLGSASAASGAIMVDLDWRAYAVNGKSIARPTGAKCAREAARAYLQSLSLRSRACARPFSEKISVVRVPLADEPRTTALWAARKASTNFGSSAASLIQAPSCWVYKANVAEPTASVASVAD